MLPSLRLLLVGLGTALPPVQADRWGSGPEGQDEHTKPFCSWKCIVFTMQWPAAFCLSLDTPSLCFIPPDINTWTIHGLWPSHGSKCCRCWPMFESDVQVLEAELNISWPSLLTTKSNFKFWRDEWEKHGACAGCMEGFNSPLQYFQICLKLRKQFDVQKLLEDAGITPSCQQPYKLSQIRSAVVPLVGDKYEIQCITDDQDRQVWFQLKVSLSANLTVGCEHHQYEPGPAWSSSSGKPCSDQLPLYYLPINHQQPHKPCG